MTDCLVELLNQALIILLFQHEFKVCEVATAGGFFFSSERRIKGGGGAQMIENSLIVVKFFHFGRGIGICSGRVDENNQGLQLRAA
jgi:hypothetical protein